MYESIRDLNYRKLTEFIETIFNCTTTITLSTYFNTTGNEHDTRIFIFHVLEHKHIRKQRIFQPPHIFTVRENKKFIIENNHNIYVIS